MEQKTQAKMLRDQLENAAGESEHVVAVNLDVRGFSSFCERNESANVVVFVREVYKRLIDRYFPQVPFVKTTGDGLLIVIPYTKESLGEVANQTLHACMQVHEAFPSLCADDPMINFKVPQKIGIGLSRGTVSRITANGGTLDYSGRAINLASRLMNIARPNGIVFDAEYLRGLALPSDLKKTFSKARIWLWGIAESEPVGVYYSKACGTKIPPMHRKRLDEREWKTDDSVSVPFGKFELNTKRDFEHVLALSYEPQNPDEIYVWVVYPRDIASKFGSWGLMLNNEDFEYQFKGGEATISFDTEQLAKMLRQVGYTSTHRFRVRAKYPI